MNIRDLEYFLACCKARSFAAAARTVHIVPSAMSAAIARLEQELGATLFDRAEDGIALTEHGAALQQTAPTIMSAVRAAVDAVAEAGGQVRGTVTLGSTLHTGRLDLAAVLSEIRDRHPGVIVQLRQSQAGSAGLVQSVREGALGIALTASTVSLPGVVLHRLFSEPMVYFCPAGHPLSRRSRITVSDLQGRILRPPPGWGSRNAIDEVLGPTSSADEVSNYSLLADLVRAGFGTTLAPASAIRGDMLTGLHAVPVEDSRLCWTLSAAVPHRHMSAAASVLLDALIKGSAGRPSHR